MELTQFYEVVTNENKDVSFSFRNLRIKIIRPCLFSLPLVNMYCIQNKTPSIRFLDFFLAVGRIKS